MIPQPPEKQKTNFVTNEMRKRVFQECHLPENIKSKIKFNDPDFHQQKREFNKQIREIIFKFYRIIPRSQNRDVLLKFADCINPGKSPDVTKLPYVGRGKNAASQNKIACVFALISWIIRVYWMFCDKDETGSHFTEINSLLNQLQEIYKNGLNQYQIQGDLAKGYYLEKK